VDLDLMFLKKTPPHSPEAERTVLGGILVSNQNLNVVLSLIAPEDFYKEAHLKILERMIALIDRDLPVDLISLSEECQRAGILEEVGGASYLASLTDGVPRSLNIEYYAKIIKEKALLRRLILSSAHIISESYDQREEADVLLNEAQTAIIDISEQRIKPGFVPLRSLTGPTLDMIEKLAQRREAVTGVPSGYRSLDNYTSGFHGSEFVVVAARPSMGKTALCLNIAQHVGARTEYAAGFFSMEMAKEQIVVRMLCAEANLDIQKVRKGFISEREFEKLKLAGETLSQARVFLDETPALSVMELKSKARRLRLERNLDILFVDYIQLMRAGGRFENRNQEMSFISRSLKELAKEIQIPVVGISQLSRSPEKRSGREQRPLLSDLRESGAIEQDADVVIFIYREEFYKPDNEEVKGLADIIIAKQRNGPVGSVKMAFLHNCARFADAEFQYGEA
jgi:replicative DNA helicase